MSWISKDPTAKNAAQSIARNLAVILGSVLATKGILDPATFEVLAGTVITLGGVVASLLKAKKTSEQVKALNELKARV